MPLHNKAANCGAVEEPISLPGCLEPVNITLFITSFVGSVEWFTPMLPPEKKQTSAKTSQQSLSKVAGATLLSDLNVWVGGAPTVQVVFLLKWSQRSGNRVTGVIIEVYTVTTQPLERILEAKPLRQGQKTRILGRQSQNFAAPVAVSPTISRFPVALFGTTILAGTNPNALYHTIQSFAQKPSHTGSGFDLVNNRSCARMNERSSWGTYIRLAHKSNSVSARNNSG